MGYTLVAVSEPVDWQAYHAIRRQELFEAKGRHGLYDENYPGDHGPDMHHYLLKLDGKPLGTTRLDVRDDGSAIFRLVAITAAEQGRGYGRVLAGMVEERARAFGASVLYVNAAATAVGFYQAVGWHRHDIAATSVQMRKWL